MDLPKRFNPLLLTIGFIIFLIGLGWFSFKQDPMYVYLGLGLMSVAIFKELREKKTFE